MSEPIEHETHASHGVRFEDRDAPPKLIIWGLAGVGAILVGSLLLTLVIQANYEKVTPKGQPLSPLAPARIVPPNPQLEVHPWDTYPQLRAHEDEILNGYGRDAAGHIHIPIEKAMDQIVARLPVRPASPTGLTTPGGEGRDSSHGLDAIPRGYQPVPQIQGEIQKHAEK